MDVLSLAVFVLKNVAVASVKDALVAVSQRASVIAGRWPSAAGFDSSQSDSFVIDKRIKHAGRV